jgi:transcriptional regulator with XRE-family HTH domain
VPSATQESGRRGPTTPLGKELATLRRRERVSQRELGRLADLSWTMIQMIEMGHRKGRPIHPSPESLRRIAVGLSRDPVDGTPDGAKAEDYYLRLMRAAGYLSTEAIADADEINARMLERLLVRELGAGAGEQIAALVRKWPDLDPEDRRFVASSIQNAIDYAERHKARED